DDVNNGKKKKRLEFKAFDHKERTKNAPSTTATTPPNIKRLNKTHYSTPPNQRNFHLISYQQLNCRKFSVSLRCKFSHASYRRGRQGGCVVKRGEQNR
ncbi:hypothetical protein CHUAL_010436, partial [Chamberlinius hualienensis]